MKKIGMCALLLLLFQVLVGCEKKDVTTEVVESDVESISEQEIVEGKASETVAVEPNSTQQTQPVVNANALKIVETVVPPYTELKVGPLSDVGGYNDFGYRFVREILRYDTSAFESETFNNDTDNYIDYETKFINTIEKYGAIVTSTDRENKTINGNQVFRLPNGEEIIYEFQYQLLQLPSEKLKQSSEFCITYYRLLNQDDFITQSAIYTKQPNVQINEEFTDDEFQKLTNIFETYINERTDFDELGDFIVYTGLYLTEEQKIHNEKVANNKFQAKKIVKSNFINSGYDEYLVFFNRGKIVDDLSPELQDFIDIVECMIVKDDVVIQSYRIDGISGYVLNNSVNGTFASKFSQGYIGDFNKNGINEIIILCAYGFNHAVFSVEFFEDHFETSMAPIGNSDFIYNWSHEYFMCKYEGIGNYIGATPFNYNQKVGWCNSQRCYILISDEIDKKSTKKRY